MDKFPMIFSNGQIKSCHIFFFLFKKPFHLDIHHKILLQFQFHAKFKAKVSNFCANKVPPNEIAKTMSVSWTCPLSTTG